MNFQTQHGSSRLRGYQPPPTPPPSPHPRTGEGCWTTGCQGSRQVAALTEWPWSVAQGPCGQAQPSALQTLSVGISSQTFRCCGYRPHPHRCQHPDPLGRQETSALWGQAPGDQRPVPHSGGTPARRRGQRLILDHKSILSA